MQGYQHKNFIARYILIYYQPNMCFLLLIFVKENDYLILISSSVKDKVVGRASRKKHSDQNIILKDRD